MSTTIDGIKILEQSIHKKIKESKNDMHESNNIAYTDTLWTEIETLQWVLGQINELENNRRIENKK